MFVYSTACIGLLSYLSVLYISLIQYISREYSWLLVNFITKFSFLLQNRKGNNISNRCAITDIRKKNDSHDGTSMNGSIGSTESMNDSDVLHFCSCSRGHNNLFNIKIVIIRLQTNFFN